jgi:hypothetical protein
MGLRSLSFHYNSEIRDKESYNTPRIMLFTAKQLQTRCLFPIHPRPKVPIDSDFSADDPDNDWTGSPREN